jgi:tetratricopeptide (TPR) repeat protein
VTGKDVVSDKNLIGVLVGMLQQYDLDEATRLYEESGRAVAEQLLALLQKSEQSLREAGARMYSQARDYARAARLWEAARYWPDAAEFYEKAGDPSAAARCWKRAGENEKAARALEACGANDEAAEIYKELKAPAQRANVLARKERWLESAAEYKAAGNSRAEVDALRAVPLEHPDRVPAVKRLAEILLARNRTQEAASLIAEVLRDNEVGRGDADLHDLLAGVFDRVGQGAQSERLRNRAERLRSREAAPTVEVSTDPGSAPPDVGYRFLKDIPIFSRLPIEDVRELYRLATEMQWTPGSYIIDSGVDAPGLIVILEGDAEVYALTEEGARHLNSVGPGAHLGEISLLSRSLTSARVTANTMVRGLHLSREVFEVFLTAHPAAALKIYRLFSEKLADRVRALSLS